MSRVTSDDSLPLVSVVIPARNEAEYVAKAVDSVAAQRYPSNRIECIGVDNGSIDGTAAIVSAAGQNHSELRLLVIAEENPGVGRAKNAGATAAHGDILIFLDADSVMEPRLVGDVVASWQAGFAAGSLRIVADSRHPIDRAYFALMELGKVAFGVRSQMLYCDRSLFLTLGGFDPDLYLAEDLDFLTRAAEKLRECGRPAMPHVRSSAIRTSPRRLRARPFHLGMFPMFGRWLLAFMGIGRRRPY